MSTGPLRSTGRTSRSLALLIASFFVLIPLSARAQAPSISIYSDAARSSCSLTAQGEDPVRAYVVVYSQAGITGVRFAAPKPACFNATWMIDELPGDYISIGDSQNDITVALGLCTPGYAHVLTMIFQPTTTTGSCCEFPVVVPVGQPYVEFIDCLFVSSAVTPTPSVINADASCPCTAAINLPPTIPSDPSPINGATNQSLFVDLLWQSSDPDGLPLHFDVYFGDTSNPPLVAQDLLGTIWSVGPLAIETTYYWKIVATDATNESAESPLWSFTTRPPGPPPPAPVNLTPGNGVTNQYRKLLLRWIDGSGGGIVLGYDVHFGTTTTPPLLASPAVRFLSVDSLALDTTYYWYVVARGESPTGSAGPTWSFHTIATNPPPTAPTSPLPANNAVGQSTNPTLRWTATDLESQALEYDVYLGTSADPPLATHVTVNEHSPTNLEPATDYYWRVVAFDSDGASASGPVWRFHTSGTLAPTQPADPFPTNGATGTVRNPTLTWTSTDPDGGPSPTFDVYFGNSASPPFFKHVMVPGCKPTGPLPLGVLARGTTYYWKIVARDPEVVGVVTEGPTWSFTTSNSNLPPVKPSNPLPADNSANRPTAVTLQWSASDPEELPLLYDLYFGTSASPPLTRSNATMPSFPVAGLNSSTVYHWYVLAHDVDGNYARSPTWSFSTVGAPARPLSLGLYADADGTVCTLADEPGPRNVYVVLDGPGEYTGVRFAAGKGCFESRLYDSSPFLTAGKSDTGVSVDFGGCLSGPVTVMTITYQSDGNAPGCCQLQISGNPLVVTSCAADELVPASSPFLNMSSTGGCDPCESSGYMRFVETREDTCLTGTPHLITMDLELKPHLEGADNGSVNVSFSPSLTFVSCERGALTQNWTTFDCDSIIGLDHALMIQGVANPGHDPTQAGVFARLTFETNCCSWSTPARLDLANATGDFESFQLIDRQLTCRYAPDGDVNGDGSVTVADAQCALDTYLFAPLPSPSGCGGPGHAMRADVDCSNKPTPSDAYCIFRHWLDQSCTFCTLGESIVTQAASQSSARVALRTVREGDEVVVLVHTRGLRTVGALGFELGYPPELELVRVEPVRNDIFAALQTRRIEPGRLRVGAYANGAPASIGEGDLLAIRLRGTTSTGIVTASQFVDDLAGVTAVSVSLDGSAVSPALDHVVLHQNSPNPFNPQTTIRFELPDAMRVRLSIFDVHGRLVRMLLDERRDAGASDVVWTGTDDRGTTVATGIYFYVLDAGGKRYQHKMVMLK